MIEFAVIMLIMLCFLGIARFKPIETELEHAIPKIKSAHLRTLEQLLNKPGPGGMATILIGLTKLRYNAALFHQVARSELRKVGNKPLETYDAHDLRIVEFASLAIDCRLMLIPATVLIRMLIVINPDPVRWPWFFVFCKTRVIEKYRELVVVALEISDSYADYLYDNLFAAL